jgi:hypothetical protein
VILSAYAFENIRLLFLSGDSRHPNGLGNNSSPRVHDRPGLYVYSGGAFPTCPGINPTLSLPALVYRAAERLVQRLANGEE